MFRKSQLNRLGLLPIVLFLAALARPAAAQPTLGPSSIVSQPSQFAGAPVTLTVTETGGALFDTTTLSNDVVRFTPTGGGLPVTQTATTPTTTTQATFSLSLPASGPYNVDVSADGGATFSNTESFMVNPDPTLTAVASSSSPATAGQMVTLFLSGSGFDSATAANNLVHFVGQNPSNPTNVTYPASGVSRDGSLMFASVALPTVSDTYNVSIIVDGTETGTVPFQINPAPLMVTVTVSPNGPYTAPAPITVTANVTGGVGSDTVQFFQNNVSVASGPATTYTPTLAAGSYGFTATVTDSATPTHNSATSAVVNITVNNPPPSIAGLSPSSTPVQSSGGPGLALTITGTGFVAASQVSANGAALPLLPGSTATQLNVTVPASALTTAGTVPVTVTNPGPGGGSVTQNLTVTNPAPQLTSVSPASGAGGVTTMLTLKGANFTAGNNTVTLSPNFTTSSPADTVTVTGLASADGATLTATVALPPDSGSYGVTVTNANGTSNAVAFTVTSSGPTLTGISSPFPASGAGGASTTLTLKGANFTAAGDTVKLSPNFTTSNPADTVTSGVVGSTDGATLTATVALPPDSGSYGVTVTNANGTSNAVAFTVTGAPTLSGINPLTGTASSVTTLTLTGTNFDPTPGNNVILFFDHTGTPVSPTPAQTITSVVKGTPDTLTATVTLPPTAGTYTVKVQNGNGTSNSETLMVSVGVPTLNTLTPNSGGMGQQNVTLTLSGQNFDPTPANDKITFTSNNGAGSPVAGLTNLTPSAATATTLTLPLGNAPLPTAGQYAVTVQTTNPTASNAQTFTVTNTPALTSITPNSGGAGQNVSLTLAGANFVTTGTNANTVTFSDGTPADARTYQATAASATSLMLTGVALPSTPGAYSVTVTNANGGPSNAVTFTVLGTPVLSGLTPATGQAGASISLRLTGANFDPTPGNNVIAFASGTSTVTPAQTITQGSSPGILLATVTLPPVTPATASATGYTVTVTNSGGTSNGQPFTVNANPPTLTGITPNQGGPGQTNVTLTLAGANFTLPAGSNTVTFTSLADGSTPISSLPASSATGTSLTLTGITLPAAGAYNVTVTNTNGSSNAVTFTATNAPTLTGITPNSGGSGKTATLTLTGTNFTSPAGSNTVTFSSGANTQTYTPSSATGTSLTLTGITLPAAGAYNVTVTNTNGGPSNAVTFTVLGTPTLTGLTSQTTGNSTGKAGAIVPLMLTGTNFDPTPGNNSIQFVDPSGNVTTPSQTVAQGSSLGTLLASVTLPPVVPLNASSTGYTVRVFNSGGTSNALPFTVNANAPILNTITPNQGGPGQTNVTLTLTGTNFTSPAGSNTVTFSSGANTQTYTPSSATGTSLILTGITLPSIPGAYSVTVTNPNGPSQNAVTFTVNGTPAISAVAPSSVAADDPTAIVNNPAAKGAGGTTDGSVVYIVISGSNFIPDRIANANLYTSFTFNNGYTINNSLGLPSNTLMTVNDTGDTITVALPADQSKIAGTHDLIAKAGKFPFSVTNFNSTPGANPPTAFGSVGSNFLVAPVHKYLNGAFSGAGNTLQMLSAPYDYPDAIVSGFPALGDVLYNPLTSGNTRNLSDILGDIASDGTLVSGTPLPHLLTWTGLQYLDAAVTGLRLGQGYWARFQATPPNATSLLQRGYRAAQTGKITEGNYFPITLNPFWNMIGDPSTGSVQLTDMRVRVTGTDRQGHVFTAEDTFNAAVRAGLISGLVYSYGQKTDGTVGYVTTQRVDPYVGYWLFADPSSYINYSIQLLVPVQ